MSAETIILQPSVAPIPFANEEVEWKEIAGFNGEYLVSNTGLVRSPKQEKRRKMIGHFVMSPARNSGGYWVVVLCHNGIQSTHSVHQLVAKTFILNPERKHDVNHKDGVKSNCNVTNLEWATRGENLIHAYSFGLRVIPNGTINGRCRLTEKQVYEIRDRVANGEGPTSICAEYGVTNTTIINIGKRKIWKHLP